MSDLMQIEMTLDEARETDRLIKRHINTTRYLLLDMQDRKGWKALGYESFKEYGEKELGYSEVHVYRLVDAAEIGLQVGTNQLVSQPSESQLRPLKAVPEEERKAIWEEATRKAEEEGAKLTAKRVEEAVAEWKQRNQEWSEQATGQRQKIRELETQIDLLQSAEKPEPEIQVVEKIPDDYESAKRQAAELKTQTDALQKQLADLKKQQDKLVNDQVKSKLQGYQSELDKLEADKKAIEDIVARKKAYLDSLSGEVKRVEVHQSVINGARLKLIGLAAFLNDMDPISDPDTIKKWLGLAGMCEEAASAIRMSFGQNPHHQERTLKAIS